MARTTTRIDKPTPTKQRSMLDSGKLLTLTDETRESVGQPPIIIDREAYNTWMEDMYFNKDNNISALLKPPANERQYLAIQLENDYPYVFTRYNDVNGWRWRMDLTTMDVTSLTLNIQDGSGGTLYSSGNLIRNNDDTGWYAECPAGQADATPTNVYFKWILGTESISRDFVYEGSAETLEGVVRSDLEYDQ